MKLATLNVRISKKEERLLELDNALENTYTDILSMCEVRYFENIYI